MAIVPDALSGRLLRNRQPLAAGLHVLLHQDRLELHGATVWIAKNTTTEAFEYQPAEGEPKMFCARTKLPLKAGARVVRCPGADCRLLYLEEAWQLLTPCHGCGFDPKLGEWRPAVEAKQFDGLAQLLELADGGASHSAA